MYLIKLFWENKNCVSSLLDVSSVAISHRRNMSERYNKQAKPVVHPVIYDRVDHGVGHGEPVEK